MAKVTAKTTPPVVDDGSHIPEPLWARILDLLPPRPVHPLGCHNPRVEDRTAMDAIFFVLRTGCQWNARNATGLCSSSWRHASERKNCTRFMGGEGCLEKSPVALSRIHPSRF
jgi:hypothetical protein